MKIPISFYLNLFKKSWKNFVEYYPVEFASSFAYFSLFGLPSIFMIIIIFLNLFLGQDFLFEQLHKQLAGVVGDDSAHIMVLITSNYMQEAAQSFFYMVFYGGTVFLLATQLLKFYQDILNDLWQIKPDFENQWQKYIKERGLTFIMVLITGLLFFISAAIEYGLEFLMGNDGVWVKILNGIMIALIVYIWFAILYKFLPFVSLPWKPNLIGAAVTTVLFFLGVVLLGKFLVKERSLEDLFDYVTPIVLISVWIFYTSLAFLFGASFTKAYAELKNKEIKPKKYAYKYKVVREE
jgi:membrane protein